MHEDLQAKQSADHINTTSNDDIIAWAQSKPNPFRQSLDKSEVPARELMIAIPEGTYAITNSHSEKPVIGTYGMS
jgi:hypothetical protein